MAILWPMQSKGKKGKHLNSSACKQIHKKNDGRLKTFQGLEEDIL